MSVAWLGKYKKIQKYLQHRQWIMKNVMFDHRNSGFKFDFQNCYDHRLSKIQNIFGSIGNSVWKLPSFCY